MPVCVPVCVCVCVYVCVCVVREREREREREGEIQRYGESVRVREEYGGCGERVT